MFHPKNPAWTPEAIEFLRECRAHDVTYAVIAQHIGVTRDACISKAKKLGVPSARFPNKVPLVRKTAPSTKPKIEKPSIPVEPIVEHPPVVLEDGHHVTLETLNDRMCKWPIGDPQRDDFHYCGNAPKTGKPYCDAHAAVAFQPAPGPRL